MLLKIKTTPNDNKDDLVLCIRNRIEMYSRLQIYEGKQ
jgi:hypothetical protein